MIFDLSIFCVLIFLPFWKKEYILHVLDISPSITFLYSHFWSNYCIFQSFASQLWTILKKKYGPQYIELRGQYRLIQKLFGIKSHTKFANLRKNKSKIFDENNEKGTENVIIVRKMYFFIRSTKNNSKSKWNSILKIWTFKKIELSKWKNQNLTMMKNHAKRKQIKENVWFLIKIKRFLKQFL